jgi:gas vesicle structural protein
LVVDIFARVSLVGIEVLRIDARVIVASVDTYLGFAESVNRLDMGSKEPAGLPEVVEDFSEAASKGIAKGKSKGAIDAGIEKLQELLEPRREGGGRAFAGIVGIGPITELVLLAWPGQILELEDGAQGG